MHRLSAPAGSAPAGNHDRVCQINHRGRAWSRSRAVAARWPRWRRPKGRSRSWRNKAHECRRHTRRDRNVRDMSFLSWICRRHEQDGPKVCSREKGYTARPGQARAGQRLSAASLPSVCLTGVKSSTGQTGCGARADATRWRWNSTKPPASEILIDTCGWWVVTSPVEGQRGARLRRTLTPLLGSFCVRLRGMVGPEKSKPAGRGDVDHAIRAGSCSFL